MSGNLNRQTVKFLKEYQWYFLGISFCLATALGWYGFHLNPAYGSRPFWDKLYLSFQLFILQSGDQANLNCYLQVARFLAPVSIAWATVRTVLSIFREEFQSLKLKGSKEHIVICGLGDKGLRILKAFTSDLEKDEKRRRIVIIETDEDNDYLSTCRERGAIVLVGDGCDDILLEKARVHRAEYVFAVTSDDNTNVKITDKIRRICNEKFVGKQDKQLDPNTQKTIRKVKCFAHVFDLRLRTLFDQDELFSANYPDFTARMFNIYDDGARFLLSKYPPDSYTHGQEIVEGEPLHVVVVGFGWAGESIVKQAIRVCHYCNHDRTEIHILDINAKKKKQRFLSAYHWEDTRDFVIHDIALDFITCDVESLYSFEDLGMHRIIPSIIYVCLGNDPLSINTAVRLRKLFGSEAPPIIACLKESVPSLFKSRGFSKMNPNVTAFNIGHYGCQTNVLTEKPLDWLARLVHERYVSSLQNGILQANGPTGVQIVEGNSSAKPWDELTEELKDSNRFFADHIPVKLRYIGCDTAITGESVTEAQADKVEQRLSEKIEELAYMEHRRWLAEKHLAGWRYGSVKNFTERTHPDLRPLKELEENEQKKDHNAIKNIPNLIRQPEWGQYWGAILDHKNDEA